MQVRHADGMPSQKTYATALENKPRLKRSELEKCETTLAGMAR